MKKTQIGENVIRPNLKAGQYPAKIWKDKLYYMGNNYPIPNTGLNPTEVTLIVKGNSYSFLNVPFSQPEIIEVENAIYDTIEVVETELNIELTTENIEVMNEDGESTEMVKYDVVVTGGEDSGSILPFVVETPAESIVDTIKDDTESTSEINLDDTISPMVMNVSSTTVGEEIEPLPNKIESDFTIEDVIDGDDSDESSLVPQIKYPRIMKVGEMQATKVDDLKAHRDELKGFLSQLGTDTSDIATGTTKKTLIVEIKTLQELL